MKDFEEETPMYGSLDERGWEIPDPTPVEIPAGFSRPESLEAMVQRMVRTRVSDIAAEEGFETFEEADDFEVDEEDYVNDPSTPYEEDFDPMLGRGITAQEFLERKEYYSQKYEEALQREAEARQVDRILDAAPAVPAPAAKDEPRKGSEPARPAPSVGPEPEAKGE